MTFNQLSHYSDINLKSQLQKHATTLPSVLSSSNGKCGCHKWMIPTPAASRLPDPAGRLLEGLHRHPLPGRHGARSRPRQRGHERHGKWIFIKLGDFSCGLHGHHFLFIFHSGSARLLWERWAG